MMRAASGPCILIFRIIITDDEKRVESELRYYHHNIVHEDEVHCSSRGHFGPKLFHRCYPIVGSEEGGLGEGPLLLALNQPRHHLHVESRVILQVTIQLHREHLQRELKITTMSTLRERGLSHCSLTGSVRADIDPTWRNTANSSYITCNLMMADLLVAQLPTHPYL